MGPPFRESKRTRASGSKSDKGPRSGALENYYKKERFDLSNELETYIMDMRSDVEFTNLKGIGQLAEFMVAKRKDVVYPLVYLLLKLALLLPVATATVERVFSAMKRIKTPSRNKMGDDWLNDCLVLYVEEAIFETIENEDIMTRRGFM